VRGIGGGSEKASGRCSGKTLARGEAGEEEDEKKEEISRRERRRGQAVHDHKDHA